MTPSRRFFNRVLAVGALVMAVLALMVIVTTLRSDLRSDEGFEDALHFHISELEYETLQLRNLVDEYSERNPTVQLAALALRLDGLKSRVLTDFVLDASGSTTELQLQATQATEHARAIITRIEPLFIWLQPGPSQAVDIIQSELDALLQLAGQLSIAARDHRALVESQERRAELRHTYLTFGLILGMVIFGGINLALLGTERRDIRLMNRQLEDRVRQRTTDLQDANARLALEIDSRKRSQKVAAERETRLDQAARLAKLGYYVWDAVNDVCEYCSDQHAISHGFTAQDYIRRAGKLDGSFGLTHPEDQQKVRRKYRELRAGNMIEMDYRVVTPIGTRRLREVARPVFDVHGKVVREIGSTIDVTDQYEIEMKLFEAQRMDSLGKMTGGVAHDFNNLLAVILGNLELMREIPDSDEREAMIDDAIKATLRGRDLTMSMLSFARRAPHDPSEINLNRVISEMEGMLRRTMPENITIEVELSDDLWIVIADRSLTENALLNLAINARDAMESGGKLKIETANVTLTPADITEYGEEIAPGHYVMMAVTDTGKGIRPEMLENIFEPFFTTKAITKNSGLGLSMVHGFIRQSGGAIKVASQPGAGTTFRLFFKSSAVVHAADGPEAVATPPQISRPLHVLLVEDDDTVRRILTRQLEKVGMTVAAAAESTSAEQMFKTVPGFDIVVSDIVMPGNLQGPALVRRLREVAPDLPAVFLSGYPQEADIRTPDDTSHDVMLMKPVSRDDLLAAIDSSINARGLQ